MEYRVVDGRDVMNKKGEKLVQNINMSKEKREMNLLILLPTRQKPSGTIAIEYDIRTTWFDPRLNIERWTTGRTKPAAQIKDEEKRIAKKKLSNFLQFPSGLLLNSSLITIATYVENCILRAWRAQRVLRSYTFHSSFCYITFDSLRVLFCVFIFRIFFLVECVQHDKHPFPVCVWER